MGTVARAFGELAVVLSGGDVEQRKLCTGAVGNERVTPVGRPLSRKASRLLQEMTEFRDANPTTLPLRFTFWPVLGIQAVDTGFQTAPESYAERSFRPIDERVD